MENKKLKVGMYVRTKYGIARIVEFYERKNNLSCYYLDKSIMGEEKYLSNCIYDYAYYTDQILNFSLDIIGLIEVGDYVNGKRVYNISIVDGLKYLDVEVEDYLSDMPFINADQIESIVTKEQFESMKYEVKE